MDYKEKYEEALERARQIHNEGKAQCFNVMTKVFPELAESEDEKIRKEILSLIQYTKGRRIGYEPRIDQNKMIDWLEKQGKQNPKFRIGDTIKKKGTDNIVTISDIDLKNREYRLSKPGFISFKYEYLWELVEQKPADKVEPKFKVGDWVVWDNKISCHIDNIYQGKWSLMYTITDTNNMIRSYSVKGFDNNTHLWTIEDAKDGDVLSAHECIVLFKEINGLNIKCHCTYHFMNNPSFYINTLQNKNAFHPATKEQCDLLFQKINEFGYKRENKKKELRKIEHSLALSEEDRSKIQRICKYLNESKKYYADITEVRECIEWLKSLRPQAQWKPSKEQMGVLANACDGKILNLDHLNSLYQDLKNLTKD